MTLAGTELASVAVDALANAREISVVRDMQVQQAFRLGEISHPDVIGRTFADAGERQAADALKDALNEKLGQESHAAVEAGAIDRRDGPVADDHAKYERVGLDEPGISETKSDVSQRSRESVQTRESVLQEYQCDLSQRSSGPFDGPATVADWSRVPPHDVAAKRLEWNQKRPEIIGEWEGKNGQDWPRYDSDVFDEKTGTKLRIAGDRFDAHHVQPLEYGGANRPDNITPMHVNEHYDHRGIHHPEGPLSRLGKLMET